MSLPVRALGSSGLDITTVGFGAWAVCALTGVSKRRNLPVVVLISTLLAACGTNVVNSVTGQAERSVMSEADEVTEGQKAHAEVLKEYSLLNNLRLQAYVNDLGQRLAKQSHRSQLKWTFTVLDSPQINAFALPGGFDS